MIVLSETHNFSRYDKTSNAIATKANMGVTN